MSSSESKFTEWTLTLLKNFANINSSILIEEGSNLRTITPTGTVYAVGKLDQTLPKTCAIFNVGKFLATLSLFKTPTILFNDDHMIIKENGREARYGYTDPKFIVSPPAKQLELAVPTPNATVVLSADIIQQVSKALGIFDQQHIGFETSKSGNLELFTTNADNPSKDGLRIGLGVKCEESFKYIFNKEKFQLLPMKYKLTFHNKKKLIRLIDEQCVLTYYIAAEGKYTQV